MWMLTREPAPAPTRGTGGAEGARAGHDGLKRLRSKWVAAIFEKCQRLWPIVMAGSVFHSLRRDLHDTRLTMVNAGRDHGRAARADRPGVRRKRLDGDHTARR